MEKIIEEEKNRWEREKSLSRGKIVEQEENRSEEENHSNTNFLLALKIVMSKSLSITLIQEQYVLWHGKCSAKKLIFIGDRMQIWKETEFWWASSCDSTEKSFVIGSKRPRARCDYSRSKFECVKHRQQQMLRPMVGLCWFSAYHIASTERK